MKSGILILIGFLGFSTPGFASEYTPKDSECLALAGVWEQSDLTEEDPIPAIFSLAPDCRVLMIQANSEEGEVPLQFEFLFKEGGQLRIQYGILPGARDAEGNPFPDPLPEGLREALQGNVYQMPDGSLRFSLDILDALCGAGSDRCVSSPFIRRF
jgi:hypothetical protein